MIKAIKICPLSRRANISNHYGGGNKIDMLRFLVVLPVAFSATRLEGAQLI